MGLRLGLLRSQALGPQVQARQGGVHVGAHQALNERIILNGDTIKKKKLFLTSSSGVPFSMNGMGSLFSLPQAATPSSMEADWASVQAAEADERTAVKINA